MYYLILLPYTFYSITTLFSSTYLHAGTGSIPGFQHPSGRFQAEQAVQATDMESGSVVASRDVQLLQGIDPRRSRRLARRQKFSTTSFIQALLNEHLVARIKNPLIPTSRVQQRKLESEGACIDAQHGTKGLVGLGTQVRFISRLIAESRIIGQLDRTQSRVDSQGLCQGHARFIRETILHL
jgi:hypothetical protein